jgi:hypothetical protein
MERMVCPARFIANPYQTPTGEGRSEMCQLLAGWERASFCREFVSYPVSQKDKS